MRVSERDFERVSERYSLRVSEKDREKTKFVNIKGSSLVYEKNPAGLI